MKLKYNHGGEVHEIPLTTDKPQGKRLAIHHDGENFYAPLVDAGDATASKLKTVYMGEVYAVRKLPPPEIENILIAPPRVSVMQGQSATALIEAEGNEAVAGLSYSIANNPTWITIADECILIQPSDNDLGEAIVEVIAKDTGSDASASAAFIAEALLRPIITQLGIAPPAVTVGQGQSATALIEAEANSAVGGLSYSIANNPTWIRNDNDTIWVEPTTNDIGTANVQVVAYDPNSSARADTSFTAEAVKVPMIYGVTASPANVTVEQGSSTVVTLAAEYNSEVTSIEYSLEGAPPWITINGNQITVAPTTSNTGSVTVVVTARDTGSGVQASTELAATIQVLQPAISGITVKPAPQIKGSRVVGWQKNTLYYPLTCTANSAVTSVRYSLAPSENNPPWLSVYNYLSLRANPATTNSALGDTATVTLVAYDTKSQAQATTAVAVNVIEKPSIGALTFSETDVTGYPEKAATITINPPSVNSGVAGIEYSLSAHPSWVTLQGNKIIAAPATGETGYKVISVQAVDTGSNIVSAKKTFSVRASVMPELTAIKSMSFNFNERTKVQSVAPPLEKTTGATYGIKYSLQADSDWFYLDSSSRPIKLRVPDSVPASSDSVRGNFTLGATSPSGKTSVSRTGSYIIDIRDVVYFTHKDGLTIRTRDNNTIDATDANDMSYVSLAWCLPHTLLVDVTADKSIPSGFLSLSGLSDNTSPPITLTAESDRKTFHIKWVRGENNNQSYYSDSQAFDLAVEHPTIHTAASHIVFGITHFTKNPPVACVKKI